MRATTVGTTAALVALALVGCERDVTGPPRGEPVAYGLEAWWDTGDRSLGDGVPDRIGDRAARFGPETRWHADDELVVIPQRAYAYLKTTTPNATTRSHTFMLVGRVDTKVGTSRALMDNSNERRLRTYLDFRGRTTGGFQDVGGDKEWPESLAPNISRDGRTTTLAMVYDEADSTAYLYRNGTLVGSRSYTPTALLPDGEITFFTVTSTPDAWWTAAGEWGHILYYGRALTADEIRTNHERFYRPRFPELPTAR